MVNQIIFSSILQTWYVELRISRSISESPLEFEITRVDCSYNCASIPSSHNKITQSLELSFGKRSCKWSKLYCNLLAGKKIICLFSSPEHEMPKVSYCDRPVSGVRRPSSTIYLNHISSKTGEWILKRFHRNMFLGWPSTKFAKMVPLD